MRRRDVDRRREISRGPQSKDQVIPHSEELLSFMGDHYDHVRVNSLLNPALKAQKRDIS